jgi:glycosyltransferase involved in cell wall biosynthesis
MGTLIIPVYKNRESLPDLLEVLVGLRASVGDEFRVTFVIDASPDDSEEYLLEHLPQQPFPSMVIRHSRNFGSFAAVRTGLEHSPGDHFAVMAADLQEPPSLIIGIFESLKNEPIDVVLGVRDGRADPYWTSLFANMYWGFYRRYILPDIPPGGVDIFGCKSDVKQSILRFTETRSSLIGQLMWVGYKRKTIRYIREERRHGVSAWTIKKKIDYLLDSVFSFSDLPIRVLMVTGLVGSVFFLTLAIFIFISKLLGLIEIGGYATIMVTLCFFGAMNLLGLGIVGTYAQRAYDNTKGRPSSIVSKVFEFPKR